MFFYPEPICLKENVLQVNEFKNKTRLFFKKIVPLNFIVKI